MSGISDKASSPEFRERTCSFALEDVVEDADVADGLADCEDEDEVDMGSTTRSGSYKKKKKGHGSVSIQI